MGKSTTDELVDKLQTVKPVRISANQQTKEVVTENSDYSVGKVAALFLLAGLASVGVYHLVTTFDVIVKFVGVPIAIALAYIVMRDK